MFTYQDKDAPVMPEPKDVHLPTLPETRLDEIDSEPESRYAEQVDPSLLNLRAAAYRGTFKQAYSILTEMTSKIGWDQLLKIRSTVFVMEDEYRTEKQEAQPSSATNRNPSTDGLRGTPDPATNGDDSDADAQDSKPDDDESPTTNGQMADAPLSKPSGTVNPSTAKGDGETVGSTPPMATLHVRDEADC
jgi:hypothetical protein